MEQNNQKGTVLVLGGSGFLGSHVVDALIAAGYSVKIYDLKPSPSTHAHQHMIIGDVLDLDALIQAAQGCRYIYNYAGLANIDTAKDNPVMTAQLNVLGNVNALEAARLAGIERYIFASSVYVYSGVGSFYRASKQSAERFVEAYHERFGLNYTILRYGSLYGRRADNNNGIYRFLKQALEQRAITYHGRPEAMREYIHVMDAAKLSVKILENDYVNTHMILTGHERMSIKNLLKMISEIMVDDKMEIKFSDEHAYGHYEMTPYAFQPKLGHKLIATSYVDMGQGLLDCLAELHEEKNQQEQREIIGDWLVSTV